MKRWDVYSVYIGVLIIISLAAARLFTGPPTYTIIDQQQLPIQLHQQTMLRDNCNGVDVDVERVLTDVTDVQVQIELMGSIAVGIDDLKAQIQAQHSLQLGRSVTRIIQETYTVPQGEAVHIIITWRARAYTGDIMQTSGGVDSLVGHYSALDQLEYVAMRTERLPCPVSDEPDTIVTLAPTSAATPNPPPATASPMPIPNRAIYRGVPVVYVNMGDQQAQLGLTHPQIGLMCPHCTNFDDFAQEPVHYVAVQPFFIDQHEVSEAQYNHGRFDRDSDPHVHITWTAARDYCISRGGNLPTEAQWSAAARGPQHNVFVSGNSIGDVVNPGFKKGVGNVFDSQWSWANVYALPSNSREWVLDEYRVHPDLPQSQRLRVVMGAGWKSNTPYDMRTTYRQPQLFDVPADDIGFRCVYPVSAIMDDHK